MLEESTINISEINKFNKIADDWSNNQGAYKILYEINPIRMNYIINKITKHFKLSNNNTIVNSVELAYNEGGVSTTDYTRAMSEEVGKFKSIDYSALNELSAIDIGCGGGLVSVELAKLGLNITGIDASPANITQAQNYAKSMSVNTKFQQGEIIDLIRYEKKYDIILCLELIEHVDNLPYFFQCLSKLLNDNGMIVISTINRTIKAFLLAIVAGEYLLQWIPMNTHTYKKFVKPSEIARYLNNTKLRIKALTGLNYNLISKEWELSDSIDVNYFAYIR